MWMCPSALGGILTCAITYLPDKIPDQNDWIRNVHTRGTQDHASFLSLFVIATAGMASGLSLGPELPLVLTAGMAGSWLGLVCKQSVLQARVMNLTAASAAVGGFFGFPMAGALFVLGTCSLLPLLFVGGKCIKSYGLTPYHHFHFFGFLPSSPRDPSPDGLAVLRGPLARNSFVNRCGFNQPTCRRERRDRILQLSFPHHNAAKRDLHKLDRVRVLWRSSGGRVCGRLQKIQDGSPRPVPDESFRTHGKP
jgi:Voltage gated chloride channel